MRRFIAAVLTAITLIALLSSAVLADSPHFLRSSSSIDSAGNLLCSFKEAGLGTISATNVTCSADATAVYACINHGGNHPQASNKETVSGPVSGGGAFPVRNGQTTGTITVAPPGPGNFSCPGNQDLVLASVSYTNVQLTGEAGTVPLANQSATFFNV